MAYCTTGPLFLPQKNIVDRSQVTDEIFYHPMDLAGILTIDDNMTIALDKTIDLPFRTKSVKKLP